jgi:hypothetical protein
MGQQQEEEDIDAQASCTEKEDYGEPEIGQRLPFVWAILAGAGLWALIGAVAYGIYLLAR